MIILKIIGIFLGGLILLLFLLSLISIGVLIHYKHTEESETLLIKVKYAFLRHTIYPDKENLLAKLEDTPQKQSRDSSPPAKPPKDEISNDAPPSPVSTLDIAISDDEKTSPERISSEEARTEKDGKRKKIKKNKPQKRKKNLNQQHNNQNNEHDDKQEDETKSLREQIDLGFLLLRSSKKALDTIRRHFIVDKLDATLKIAGADAHETAVNYGKIQILTTNLLALIMEFVTIRIKRIQLDPDFLSENSQYKVDVRLRIRPIWILKAGFHLLFAFLRLRKLDKNKTNTETKYDKGGNNHERETTTR